MEVPYVGRPNKLGVGLMRARRIIDGASFDPDVLKIVREAFEDCWREVSGAFSPEEFDDAREFLAKTVMATAREDSVSTGPLHEAAMQAMQRRYPGRLGGQAPDGKASEG
jgi:hypothetical protein